MKPVLLFAITLSFVLTYTPSSGKQKDKSLTSQQQKDNSIHSFWKWFKENQTRLKNFETNPDLYLNELLTQAKKIKPGLAIELEPPQQGVIKLTISADGDRNLFPTVKRMVAMAPQVEGWNIIAFRQRMTASQLKTMILKTDEYELNPADMKFFPMVSDDSLDVIVYCNGITDSNYNQVAYQCLLLLDNILGEYDCVTKVRAYDFHNMPDKKEDRAQLYPLLGLTGYLDRFYEQKKQEIKK